MMVASLAFYVIEAKLQKKMERTDEKFSPDLY